MDSLLLMDSILQDEDGQNSKIMEICFAVVRVQGWCVQTREINHRRDWQQQ